MELKLINELTQRRANVLSQVSELEAREADLRTVVKERQLQDHWDEHLRRSHISDGRFSWHNESMRVRLFKAGYVTASDVLQKGLAEAPFLSPAQCQDLEKWSVMKLGEARARPLPYEYNFESRELSALRQQLASLDRTLAGLGITSSEGPNAGWIYVLVNSSHQGLVKIGRTGGDVRERARHLSAATGVPTPFVVAFECKFDDCVEAEEYIHRLLERQNCRVRRNREFFEVSTTQAIEAVVEAKRFLKQG